MGIRAVGAKQRWAWRRLLTAVSIATVVASLGAVAQAQEVPTVPEDPTSLLPDPGTEGERLAKENDLDTNFTPLAKDGSTIGWTQWTGAVHPRAEGPDGHPSSTAYEQTVQNGRFPIPPTVDFYTVSFLDPDRGLAGGAQCEEDAPERARDAEGNYTETNAAYQERITPFLSSCERVPVIYRYIGDDPELGAHWEPAYKGSSPGYVGAISWLQNTDVSKFGHRALAVGGDGVYVRRESGEIKDSGCDEEAKSAAPGVDQSSSTTTVSAERALSDCEDRWRRAHDPAGMGRAWLLSGGKWRDLNAEGDVPARMRGMSALDSSTRPEDCTAGGDIPRRECAMAGGLQQIWMWADDQFDATPWEPDIGDTDPETNRSRTTMRCGETTWACAWHFRVRSIRFRPGPVVGTSINTARAVTAGCCSATGQPDNSRGGASRMTFSRTGERWDTASADDRATDVTAGTGPVRQYRLPKRLADSLYAFVGDSSLRTPGGPERPGEPPSQITKPGFATAEVPGYSLTSARLVAGDGDLQGPQPPFSTKAFSADSSPRPPDGQIDWAVGGFKAPESRDRAAAFTTTTAGAGTDALVAVVPDLPYPSTCPLGDTSSPDQILFNNATSCELDQDAAAGRQLYALSSYFLNGFAMVGNTGVGWGVGDRGAIERLAGDAVGGGSGGTVPPEMPPLLGAKQLSPAPARTPYGSDPELSGEPGAVPALAANGQLSLSEPRVTAYGAPEPERRGSLPAQEEVREIAMSRDGSEGWAIGPVGALPTVLYRFDGVSWSRCNPDSVEGAIEPDPACESLWPLFHYLSGYKFTAIERVPTELGDDPTRLNDFEAVAAAVSPGSSGELVMLRYRDGRWTVDEPATDDFKGGSSPPLQIAFSAPDDGWMATRSGDGVDEAIWHFDGESWTRCASRRFSDEDEDKAACEDLGAEGATGFISPAQQRNSLRLTSAGRRVYLYGSRQARSPTGQSTDSPYPFILYQDPGPCTESDTSGCWQQAYDPGCVSKPQGVCLSSGETRDQGRLSSLSVALGADGSYNGWGAGFFGRGEIQGVGSPRPTRRDYETPLIHRDPDPDREHWEPEPVDGAPADYLFPKELDKEAPLPGGGGAQAVVALPGPHGEGRVFVIGTAGGGGSADGPIVWRDPRRDHWRDPRRDRWRAMATPFANIAGTFTQQAAEIQLFAPDNAGGLWIVATPVRVPRGQWFYRFSDQAPRPVFDDVGHPVREPITAAAGGPDGSFWVATDTNAVYRYDRVTGWDRMTVKGWDPGRIVTRQSEANAIAVGPGGEGLLVGRQGRVAEVGPGGARLDAAAGILCPPEAPSAPCGSGRDLQAAAIAPDRSAMVGGEARALLYRPPGGEFSAATPPPPMPLFATVTGISMPEPGRAYLATDGGQIWRGDLGGESGNSWDWTREDRNEFGGSLSRDTRKVIQPLRAVAFDSRDHGYAVGGRGTILERTGEDDQPWRRADAGVLQRLDSVTVDPSGRGALIGGEAGLVLTGTGASFAPARYADMYRPTNSLATTSEIAGTALLPGYRDGQLEAWVAPQDSATGGALLHYTSDPDEPLLDGGVRRAAPLADSPPARPEELGFTAFGNHGCQLADGGSVCEEMIGTAHANEVTARAVRDAILAGRERPDGSRFALLTGDVGDYGGRERDEFTTTPLDPSLVHRRWAELIADPLLDAGIPVYGAVGRRDLSDVDACNTLSVTVCASWHASRPTRPLTGARTTSSLGWRQGMAGMPAPWGAPGAPVAPSRGGLSFEAVETANPKFEPKDTRVDDPTEDVPDQTVEDPTGALRDQKVGGGVVGDRTIPTGGARTHYAFDVVKDGEALMRVAVLDSSLDSLAGSDPNQNPTEEQLAWLREVLSTWPADKRAVVVTNTPTYSYGPGALTDTAPDGTALESVLMANDVDLVVSGREGWNGVYWAFAPGVHCPPPGGAQPDPNRPPSPAECGGAESGSQADQASQDAQRRVGEALGGAAGDLDPLPFLIASSAGVNPFGPRGEDSGSAADGFWHGYTDIRIDPTSDAPPIIEQRPVFDWIGIAPAKAATHVMRPNQRLPLRGYGREAAGIDVPFRYDEISTPAITHRFDLLVADPAKPWLPKQGSASDDCDPYDCLDSSVATIDPQSGDVKAGNGNYTRTFAIALLSVDQRSAVYPLVFEPRSSYRAPTPTLPRPSLPPPPSPPSQPPRPGTPNVEPPPPPAIPPTESPLALTPVIPPTPPSYGNASPIDLGIAPVAIVAPPPTVVLQPPNPVVQPAPPSGARREARQRQAASQKSGAGAEEVSDIQESGGDLADNPNAPGTAMTRHEFTAIARQEPVSAWVRDALIGGGLGIAALVLALGLSGARPTPRRRQPEAPAPAWSRPRPPA